MRDLIAKAHGRARARPQPRALSHRDPYPDHRSGRHGHRPAPPPPAPRTAASVSARVRGLAPP